MRFLADECCDAALVDVLRRDGHDVLYAIESLRGATDDDLLTRAVSERRILLTEDKDFGESWSTVSGGRHTGSCCCGLTSVTVP